MYKYKYILGFIVITILMPFMALAQDNTINNLNTDHFVYIEASGGHDFYGVSDISLYSGSNTVYSITGNDDSGNSAISADIGYQLTKHFAAEFGFIKTSKFDATYTYTEGNDPGKLYSMSVNPWTAYLAGKWSFPIVQKLSAFVKLGIAYQKATLDDTNAHEGFSSDTSNNETYSPLLGVGVQYDITPKIYIFGQGLTYLFTNDFSDNGFLPIDFELNHNATVLVGVGYKFQ